MVFVCLVVIQTWVDYIWLLLCSKDGEHKISYIHWRSVIISFLHFERKILLFFIYLEPFRHDFTPISYMSLLIILSMCLSNFFFTKLPYSYFFHAPLSSLSPTAGNSTTIPRPRNNPTNEACSWGSSSNGVTDEHDQLALGLTDLAQAPLGATDLNLSGLVSPQ